MRYQVLGPLRVQHAGRPVDLGPPKQRAVLAALLLAGGAVVSVDRLVDAVWGDDPPGNASASLQAYISNLRKALRGDGAVASPIVRQAPGYYLALGDDGSVDLSEFTARCGEARSAVAAGDWAGAVAAADAALAFAGGGLLTDIAELDWLANEAVRVDDLHTECLENRATALLALGRVSEALTDSTTLRSREPLRDRPCWLHMLALYRAGRAAEALEAYTAHAAHLADELGLDPGAELRELQAMILRQSPELATWPRPPAWTGAAEVAAPTPAVRDAAVAAPASSALIGRDRELAAIVRLLGESTAGNARWLVLTGPAGIGKTRLAQAACEGAAAAGSAVIWVSCPDERGIPPWWPMRQLLRALGADADTVLQVPPDADPDTARFLVYERIQLLLQVNRPLLVVVDDAQWADSTSLSALTYIAGALRDHPVAVVVTVRDGEQPPGLDRLLGAVARGEGNRRIDVPALTVADVASLANGIAEEPADLLTESEARVLAERTGGNPFFVSEYARLPRAERTASDIPSAIRSVLDRRLAGLDPPVLQVLRAAAVLGDVFDSAAIALLAATTRLDMDGLADYLDEAADERILIGVHGGAGYGFAHGLLREHLLAGLPPLRRQRLHAQVAELLAADPSPEVAGRRAQHLIEAIPLADPQDVVLACRQAAEQAAAQWSSEIAAQWWQAALDTYDLLPARQRCDGDRDALTVDLLRALARAGRGQTVLDAAATGLADALAAGRPATAGRIASELLRVSGGWPWLAPGADPGELVELLWRAVDLTQYDPAAEAQVRAALAVGHCYHPDQSVAADQLARSAEAAARTEDPDVAADALMGRLITYSGVSAFSSASLAWADELLALPHSRSREDNVIAHSVATMAALNLADIDSTRAHLKAGILGSEELRLPALRAQLRWMEAVLAVWQGDFAEAERHHRIATHVHDQTELYEAGSGMIAVACLLRERGESMDEPAEFGAEHGGDGMVAVARAALLSVRPEVTAEVVSLLRSGIKAPHIWTGLGHTALLAQLCAEHGLSEFAPALLQRLVPHRDELAVIGQVGIVGPVALATARLRALLGDIDGARRDLVIAEALAERGGGAPSLLRARLVACELAADSPDVGATAAGIAAEADRLGMRQVGAAARLLIH